MPGMAFVLNRFVNVLGTVVLCMNKLTEIQKQLEILKISNFVDEESKVSDLIDIDKCISAFPKPDSLEELDEFMISEWQEIETLVIEMKDEDEKSEKEDDNCQSEKDQLGKVERFIAANDPELLSNVTELKLKVKSNNFKTLEIKKFFQSNFISVIRCLYETTFNMQH